jgi:hypothetical protein
MELGPRTVFIWVWIIKIIPYRWRGFVIRAKTRYHLYYVERDSLIRNNYLK